MENLINNILNLDEGTRNTADVMIGPLYAMESVSLANLLKQYLMHSVKGYAITGIKIPGVMHAFSLIPGVKEDMHAIIRNLKNVVVKASGDMSYLSLNHSTPGVIKAGDLRGDVEVLNPEQVICTLTEGQLSLELFVSTGTSYVSEADMIKQSPGDGWLMFAADFSPVKHVIYNVKDVTVGKYGSLEELIFTVTTNGSMTPLEAVTEAARRLHAIMSIFLSNDKTVAVQVDEDKELPFDKILLRAISELDLSARAQSCVRYYDLTYIGELVMMSPEQLLAVPNVGQTSVTEIMNKLAMHGLKLCTILVGWPEKSELPDFIRKHS